MSTFKLEGNYSGDVSTLLTPSSSVSGTSMYSKTSGGELEDRRSLNRLFVNQLLMEDMAMDGQVVYSYGNPYWS